MFEATSRYYLLEDAIYTDEHGHHTTYKRRRFLPQGMQTPLLAEVTVKPGDRLDLIAARTLRAPEHFWRICDANNAMNPFDLTEQVGTVLRVTLPQFQDPT
ncbi:MAG TPA: LysM domain-containing protein [Ktedonobacteraceae bacterium]|nr:LysM domain-containing protein [Ktedonobacteraceae bacterium]